MDRNAHASDALGFVVSLSARRAWIEIPFILFWLFIAWSLSARRAWIEIDIVKLYITTQKPSLSARRAWIEIMRLQ